MSTVNGTDVGSFNARQHHVEIGHLTVNNESAWQKGSARPFLMDSDLSFKTLTIVYHVKGVDRAEIIENVSELLALFQGEVTVELDGFSNYFRGFMTDHSEEETAMRRWHTVTVNLNCYEYGPPVTASGENSVTIINPGNVPSPCIVTLTPTIGLASISVSGICRNWWTLDDLPVTISSVSKDVPIVLDGMTGKITEDGKLKEVAIWELPTLLPGKNVISCENVVIKAECIPMFM